MAHSYLDSLILVCCGVAKGIIPEDSKAIYETTAEIAKEEGEFEHLCDLLCERTDN